MFRQFVHLPLRRCLSTTPSNKPHTSRLVLVAGASAVAATLVTWNLTSARKSGPVDFEKHASVSVKQTATLTPPNSMSSSSAASSSTSPSVDVSIPPGPSLQSSDTQLTSTADSSTTPSLSSEMSDEEPNSDESSGSEGAYNPVTGEINWDCPCLGGMAHGVCGPQFREAFSCFVYSEKEPKGVDCIDKFKGMQDCFREHPDVYGEEIDEEDEAGQVNEGHVGAVPVREQQPQHEPQSPSEQSSPGLKAEETTG